MRTVPCSPARSIDSARAPPPGSSARAPRRRRSSSATSSSAAATRRNRAASRRSSSCVRIRQDSARGAVRQKLTARLRTLDLEAELLAPLAALLDIDVADERWISLDTQQRARRMLDALRRLIVCESAERPVVIALEDLHWIDADTQI